MIRWMIILGIFLFGTETFAQQPAPKCQSFKVKVSSLNISAEPRGDSTYIDVLEDGDIACVTVSQHVNDRDWSFIVYVAKGNERRSVGGWANQQGLQRVSESDSVAEPVLKAPSAATSTSPAPAKADTGDDTIQWDVPIASGPYPIVGQTIEQLAQRAPLFSPFEGLDEKYWKKDCNNCHQWTRATLCTQGRAYMAEPNKLLRIKHPFGGPLKLALLRWAKDGCP